MKILSADQIREADRYTIKHEPISSLDLMERASQAFVKKFIEIIPEPPQSITVFCGTGNNGGDGLAIARILIRSKRDVRVFILGNPQKGSSDFIQHFDMLKKFIEPIIIDSNSIPTLSKDEIVIDAIFGSGLSRPVKGLNADVIENINQSPATVISVDIASGLFADHCETGHPIVRPHHTISFQLPKLAFMQPDLFPFVGKCHIVDIELNEEFILNQPCPFELSTKHQIKKLLPSRNQFAHKGDAGRLLIVAGSIGKMGATILATKGALRSGAGLVHVHAPRCGRDILQTSVPEAMVSSDADSEIISDICTFDKLDAVAIGPGIGTNKKTITALQNLLIEINVPMVIDADAINILASKPDLLKLLPEDCVLTPHPGEFKRLVGDWNNDDDRLIKLRTFCKTWKVNMVLKGAFSAVCDKKGRVFFNSTGNPGMATAGSGDVLTGIVGSLLAQRLASIDALRLGVFLHGSSGDLAEDQLGQMGLIASDLINYLPSAILALSKS